MVSRHDDPAMRILHLSDLHYGRRDATHSAHYFTDGTGAPRPETLVNILEPVARDRPPTAVVVSGDIAWRGSNEDYGYAHAFLDALRDRLNVPIVITAGNHDVDWSIPESSDRQDRFVAFLRRFYGDAEFQRLHPQYADTDAKRRHRISALHRLLDDRLTILTVNSAAGEGPDPEPCGMCQNPRRPLPPVLVSPRTLVDWQEDLARHDDDFRILVVHHHLFPFKVWPEEDTTDPDEPEDRPDRTIIANSARLQSWLAANKFSLVLHGHKHRVHVRHDLLVARHENHVRDILVLGAGSTGVYDGERGNDNPLSFNTVEAEQLRDGVFDISVNTYRIETVGVEYVASLDSPRIKREVGKRRSDNPLVVHARGVPECYNAIAANTKHETPLVFRNFMSIVDVPAFIVPKSARLRGEVVTEVMIRKSFATLHPECDLGGAGWSDEDEIKRRLDAQPQRFRFQHGNRLFAVPATITAHGPTQFLDPLESAINEIGSSRAYVGLYNAFLDARDDERRPPPPCLVGIQFQRDGNVLNLVAMFRKLELSFWWLVNMFEMEQLLKHAVSQREDEHLTPGSITFYASLAEWKGDDPGPTFAAELDDLSTSRLVALGLELTQANNASTRALLVEKRSVTNEDNIDERGLATFCEVLGAFVAGPQPGHLNAAFVAELRAAADQLTTGLGQKGAARKRAVDLANRSLDNALGML